MEVTGRSVAAELRRLVWHLDEPIGDPVTVGNYLLAASAARDSSWVLNGEGGDPLFGGPKNLPMLLAHWYPTGDDPRFREAQYLATWRRAGEEIGALLHPDLLAEIDLERDLDGVVRPYFTADRPKYFLNKLMVANMRLKGAHLILPKVDRMLGASRRGAAQPALRRRRAPPQPRDAANREAPSRHREMGAQAGVPGSPPPGSSRTAEERDACPRPLVVPRRPEGGGARPLVAARRATSRESSSPTGCARSSATARAVTDCGSGCWSRSSCGAAWSSTASRCSAHEVGDGASFDADRRTIVNPTVASWSGICATAARSRSLIGSGSRAHDRRCGCVRATSSFFSPLA